MDRKWTGNGPEMDRKWIGNGPEMDRKWTGNGPEMDRKWTGNEYLTKKTFIFYYLTYNKPAKAVQS